mgnify:CR=1 FL=1
MTDVARAARTPRAALRARVAALVLGLVLGFTQASCAVVFGARLPADARPGATTLHTLTVDGRARHVILHLPPQAARGPVPLVLAFHGDGANAGVLRHTTRLDAAADRLGLAVAYPDGTGALGWAALSWHADRDCCGWALAHRVDDVGFAVALVHAFGAVRAVDTARVAAVGFSAGGTLALRLACDRAGLLRAVADVAGTMPHAECRPARALSVLLVQGGDDDELRGELHLLRLARAPRRTHSLENALAFWGREAGCAGGPPARGGTPGDTVEWALGCRGGQAVELHTIADNPHAWPGGRRPWLFAPRPADHVDGAALVLGFVARALQGA